MLEVLAEREGSMWGSTVGVGVNEDEQNKDQYCYCNLWF